MSERENNEIDKLLRGLARGAGAGLNEQNLSATEESSSATSDHLDADEMNAYAARALPEAARLRYTAHLADCGECREIVTQLSAVVGLPAPKEVVDRETATSSWREKLARFFAPGAWRYAIPALVLLAAAALGLFVFRQKSDTSFLAENNRAERPQVSAAPDGQQSSAGQAAGGTGNAGNAGPSPATRTHTPAPAPNSRPAGNAGATTTESNARPAVAQAEDKDSKKQTPVDQPVAAEAPPPPTPAADKTTAATPARNADEIRAEEARADKNKKEAERKDTAGVSSGIVAARRRAAVAEPQGGRGREQPTDSRAAGGAGARDGEDDPETRSVAGHRFRRQNGVWVDVAFNSSRSTISVARGSEQYRALVADEPGIRSVAEQLSGPLILVWNGHAYRIQ